MKRTLFLWLISIINSLLIIPVCSAQISSEHIMEEVIENSSVDNDVEEPDWENELEALSVRLKEPVNLNTVTREQLEQFPFLTDIQIEHLLAYIYLHGEMHTLYELQLVKDMDKQTIQRLLPFVCLETGINNEDSFRLKSLLKNGLKYGKNELLIRTDIPFYKRKGYEHTYLGPSVYNSVKYSFRYRENLYLGLVGEKDSGEPFGALYNKKGYDYYSFYFLLRDAGWLKTLAIGSYRLSFGQGLVISTDYLMGKTAYISSLTFRNEGITKHASTDEYHYFQGLGATISLGKHWLLSSFYSRRELDGVLKEGEITSIYKTGLHRSQKEADKKDLFTLQLTGGNLTYQSKGLKLGVTGIYYFFNHPYEPELKEYSKYNLHGNYFYNAGVNYAYRWRRLFFQGETAIGKSGFASLNRLQYSPMQGYQFTLLHRYYSYNYWAMFGRSFGESSTVQNENGLYLATDISPFSHWRFFLSFDVFSFPWKKYQISKPSHGLDGLFQADFSPDKKLAMYLKYRYKQKERDVAATNGKLILSIFHHQIRYRLNYSPVKMLLCRTTLDYNYFHSQDKTASRGYQATQMISYQLPSFPLHVEMQGSYFHTDDYDSRVYIAEKGLLYSFYTPSFQGEGVRIVVHIRWNINKHWIFLTKFGETIYNDRSKIGSGNDLIRGNKKADIQMQLCVKF